MSLQDMMDRDTARPAELDEGEEGCSRWVQDGSVSVSGSGKYGRREGVNI